MRCYIVMGVAGSGKTTIARALANRFGGLFLDGDDYHPKANVLKMASGIPLTDDDRWNWLEALNLALRKRATSGRLVFLACSALRQVYRDKLSIDLPGRRFIYLKGSKEEILDRLKKRRGHFMPASLLESQFSTLEAPANAITVNIAQSVVAIVDSIEREIISNSGPI